MKKLFIVFPLLMIASCGEYKAIMAEKTSNIKDSKLYFKDKNNDILTVTIDGVEHDMLFDTGAGATLLYNPKFQVIDKQIIRDKTIYGFDKKTKIRSYTYSSNLMSSGIFKTEKKYLYVVPNKRNLCSKPRGYDGILGSFFESDMILEINYEEGFVQFLDHVSSDDAIELNAKFNSFTGKFAVELEVNGQKDYFLFDTGNKTMTMLNKKVFTNLNAKIYAIEFTGQSVGKEFTIKADIYQEKIYLGDKLEFYYSLGLDNSSERSILNKNFIEKFNWYIDKKNSKVYCKPINMATLLAKTDLSKRKERMYANEYEGKLLVSSKNFESTIHIGDQIISVDNQKVTAENICQLLDLLNKADDWKLLKPEIIPKK